jgi:hypothetical protein
MTVQLGWKVGFEIELMAPPDASRRTLAERVAKRVGGRAVRIFHPESEHSKVPGTPIFENLTLGYRVEDAGGAWVASFIDDLTLQFDFNKQAKPQPGWYRIVSDDARFLRLIECQCDAEAPLEQVLDPLAQLFGVETDRHPEGMLRVSDRRGATVAIAAPLPGERERPCEIVTAPIASDHFATLDALLEDACALGFAIPKESATHIHFDAKPLRSAHFIRRFVQTANRFGGDLRRVMRANPNCVRIGGWPAELAKTVDKPEFASFTWDEVRATLIGLGLTKYCDFNLVNMVNQDEYKDTLEVRILPGLMDTRAILKSAAFFEALLRWCADESATQCDDFEALIAALTLDPSVRDYLSQG